MLRKLSGQHSSWQLLHRVVVLNAAVCGLQMSRVRLSAKALDGLRANTEQDVLHYQVRAQAMFLPAALRA